MEDEKQREKIQGLKRELWELPDNVKGPIARDMMRSLEPSYRTELASEFVRAQEDREDSQRKWIIYAASLIIVFALAVLVLTLILSPESIEYVGGVLTTVTGAVAGYIGGRATSGGQPPTDENTE